MKIRLSNNSIRIRLSQSDLDSIKNGISLSIQLPIGTQDLVFTLKFGETIECNANEISIALPQTTLLPWIASRETSLSTNITYPNNRTLRLIVEKDFLG
ncbi:MAG: hypothetical protein RLZZ504_303 [Bacteroidota bacterium]|jgi:hypothetical protein